MDDVSRDMVKVGGIGAIFCLLAVIAQVVAIIILWVSPIDYLFAGVHIDFGSGIAWAVGLVLVSIGAFGLWKQYENSFSRVVGIMGLVTAAAGLAATAISWIYGFAPTSISAIFAYGFSILDTVGISGLVWLELNGVFLILLGVCLFKLKDKTGVAGATRSTGILTLIVGALYCAVIPYGYLATQGLLLAVGILMAYVLFKAR